MLSALLWVNFNNAPAVASSPAAVTSGDDRELSTPTAWWIYSGQTATDISNFVSSNNARIVDINVNQVSPSRLFDVAYVSNTGVYAKTWDWGYDLTGVTVTNLISGSLIRFISFKAYEVSPGNVRYAAVWIANSGADAKNWHPAFSKFVCRSSCGNSLFGIVPPAFLVRLETTK